MNTYQLVFITAQDSEQIQKKMDAYLQESEGTIATSHKWGKRDFAYPIKKHTSGYYFEWNITIDQSKISGFKKKMNYDEEILRHLLIKLKVKN